MAETAAVTVRLPTTLKAKLEARARAEHRSLSAQVVAELERSPATDAPEVATAGARFLDLCSGTAVPSEADFAEVRAQLWGRFPRPETS